MRQESSSANSTGTTLPFQPPPNLQVQNAGSGISMITIQGGVYHRMGSLEAPPGQEPKFMQLYIVDSAETAQRRCDAVGGCVDLVIVQSLQNMLHTHHPYLQTYQTARGVALADPSGTASFDLIFNTNNTVDVRRYNEPTAAGGEVAAFIPDSNTEPTDPRSFSVRCKVGGPRGHCLLVIIAPN
jgi:hypothetical protein